MKNLILLGIVMLAAALPALAKRDETLTLQLGKQKTSSIGKLKVRFVAIDSDSRCPINAQCVWAGNARVKITVSKGRRTARTFELNSTHDPKTATYEGYDIQFVDLTPHPGENIVGRGTLTLSITKHS